VRFVIILVVCAVAIVILDRLLLAAERRGWIYWRKRKASPGTTASAMLEIQSLVEPGRAHTVEVLREELPEVDDEGDDVDDDAET
jgi:hypothetical protein